MPRPDPLAPGQELRPVVDGRAIHPGTTPATFVETIEFLWNTAEAKIAEERAKASTDGAVLRALAMVKTSLEDARIRYTEARARQLGVFSPADLDRVLLEGKDPAAKFAERDARANSAAIAQAEAEIDELVDSGMSILDAARARPAAAAVLLEAYAPNLDAPTPYNKR